MMHVKFDGSKMMEKLSKMVDNISQIDIDAAIYEALNELANVLLEEMQFRVMMHYKTGDAYRAIKRTDVQRAGNFQWVEVGAMRIRHEDKEGFHVIYQEYGSPGKLEADPWLRPTMEDKALIRQTILAVFKKWGVPNVKAA